MQFLFPGFLLAAAVIAIPIIIHLFYFRKFKKVYFTNVRFLKELKEETSSRSKLRNLLVLLMRIFAFLSLVMAFAQPFLSKENQLDDRARAVAIYLDNSFSMLSLEDNVPIFDRARQKALDIAKGFGEADQFLLLTNDLSGRHMRWVDKNTVVGFIESIEIGPAVQNLSTIQDRFLQMSEKLENSKAVLYIISDFQKSITDFDEALVTDISLIPMGRVMERNLSIDSCWLESPVALKGQTVKLIVKTSNYDKDVAENIRLSIDYAGESKPVGSITVPAGSSSQDTISLLIKDSGWQEIAVNISDYPIQFDDTYYLAIQVPEKMTILSIHDSEPNRYMETAYRVIPEYELTQQSANSIDYALLSTHRLIILNQLSSLSSGLAAQLTQAVNAGVNLLIFPKKDTDLTTFNSFLSAYGAGYTDRYERGDFQAAFINSKSFVFDDVFERIPENLKLPSAEGRYPLGNNRAETLIRFRDGKNLLEAYETDGGYIYQSAISLDRSVSNLIASAEVFVPLLHRAVLQTRGDRKSTYVIGRDEQVSLEIPDLRGDITYSMEGPSKFVPGIRNLGSKKVISVFSQISKAGVFRLVNDQDEILAMLPFNYDRIESDPSRWTVNELKVQFPNYTTIDQVAAADLTGFVAIQDRGTLLWRTFLMLAIVFLLIETLLLRFWKI
jgi:hypothetical protein